jgi:hypothetical protein
MTPENESRAREERAQVGNSVQDEALEDGWFKRPSQPSQRIATMRPPAPSSPPIGDAVADEWFR